MSELADKIKTMLDNEILDWDRPTYLSSGRTNDNYAKLIPAISHLIASTLTDFAAKVKAESFKPDSEPFTVVTEATIDRLLADTVTRIKEQ